MEKFAFSVEEIFSQVKERIKENSDKAQEGLKSQNNVAFDAYIERAIALEDLLTWMQRRVTK